MSFALLTKVAGMSTAVSTTLASGVYYSFRDSKFDQHLQKVQSQEAEIKKLEERKETLSIQLGKASQEISVTLLCKGGKKEVHKLDSKTKSTNLKCGQSDTVLGA